MRRLIIGLSILAVLLALSIGVSAAMERIHSPVAEALHQAAEAAQAEDWKKAGALAESAKARWEKYWYFTAAVADHTPMDDADGLFAELEIYLQEQEMPHFAATAMHLSQLTRAMADSHHASWWNLL